jgi:hypothetical protein
MHRSTKKFERCTWQVRGMYVHDIRVSSYLAGARCGQKVFQQQQQQTFPSFFFQKPKVYAVVHQFPITLKLLV